MVAHCGTSTTLGVFGLSLLDVGLLPVNLVSKLGCTSLVLHDLRVEVWALIPILHLILMLLVHLLLLLLCIEPLLGSVGGLVSSQIALSVPLGHLNILLLTAEVLTCGSLGAKVAVLGACCPCSTVSISACRLLVAAIGSPRGILLVVFCTVGWPVNSIAEGLTTATENWERPQPLVASKDLGPILVSRDVVEGLLRVALHFKVLDGGLVGKSQFNVELEEHCHQNGDYAVQHEGYLDHNVRN